jgi:hypothetical protein
MHALKINALKSTSLYILEEKWNKADKGKK